MVLLRSTWQRYVLGLKGLASARGVGVQVSDVDVWRLELQAFGISGF